jgi:hypothetical protein
MPTLTELAIKYFQKQGYQTEQNVTLEGKTGLPRKFDLKITREREQQLVWIKDWKRTTGINMIINLDQASTDVKHENPIIVSNKFSGHAKAYANRRNITLITKRQIIHKLKYAD